MTIQAFRLITFSWIEKTAYHNSIREDACQLVKGYFGDRMIVITTVLVNCRIPSVRTIFFFASIAIEPACRIELHTAYGGGGKNRLE